MTNKAESSLVAGYVARQFTQTETLAHLSTNRSRRRTTSTPCPKKPKGKLVTSSNLNRFSKFFQRCKRTKFLLDAEKRITAIRQVAYKNIIDRSFGMPTDMYTD